jgi:hypothetical protein
MQAQGDTASLRELELASLDESNRALQQRIYALSDEKAAQDGALAALRRATSAQIELHRSAANAASEMLSSASSIFDSLGSGINRLRGESSAEANAATARRFIEQALSTAQLTGYLPDATQLSDAMEAAIGGITSSRYSSSAEYEFAQAVLAGELQALQDVAGTQKSAAQRQLDAAEEQIDYLTKLTTRASEQLDALRGIDNSVLSVGQALSNFQALVGGGKAAGGSVTVPTTGGGRFAVGGNDSGTTTYNPADPNYKYDPGNGYRREVETPAGSTYIPIWDMSEAARIAEVKRVYDAARGEDGLASLFSNVRAAGGTLSDLQVLTGHSLDDLRKAAASVGIPAFASGGSHRGGLALVGENGPELAYLPPARIYNAGDTSRMLGGGKTDELIGQLIADNRTQAGEIVRLNLRLTKLLEKWDVDGMPLERSEVAA